MHEQNFEKQVQQKMEELSLPPSAPVWQKVEGQIRNKKDRKRIVFWLFPLLLVGGGAWWLLSGTGDSQTPAATTSVTQQQPATPAPGPSNILPAPPPSDYRVEQDLIVSGTGNLPAASPTRSTGALSKPAGRPDQITRTIVPQPEVAFTGKESQPSDEVAINKKETALIKEEVAINKGIITAPPSTTDTASAAGPDLATKPVEPAMPTEPVADIQVPAKDSSAVAEKTPSQKNKTSKWQWAVHAEAGITSEQSELFQMPSARAQPQTAGPATGGGNFFYYTPSPATNGPAFSGGITVKRLLGERTRLTAGLQYNFYSTRMAVGQKVGTDTTVSYATGTRKVASHYRPGNHNSYHNHYHFIQLPVGIEYQVLRKLPIHVHAGVSVAQLINTNALLYDYNARIFYKNSSAFNNTQLHLFTNLTYTLWKGKAKSLNVGPYAQYSVTELQKAPSDKNRLFSAGVRSQLSF